MKRTKLFLGLLLTIGSFYMQAQTTTIKGLTVIVEFADFPFNHPIDSISKMMNQPNFIGWGNEGSVRDFFLAQTNGKVLITSEVIKVSLPYNAAQYYGAGATRRDLSDIIDAINLSKPNGFVGLSVNPSDNSLVHFNILTKTGLGAWAFGPQPGSNSIKNNGQSVYIYTGNLTNYSQFENPDYATICHEMGHNVMKWPDYYYSPWTSLGNYCNMSYGTWNKKNPQDFNPALRLKNGWIDNVVEIGTLPYDKTYTVVSNNYNTIHKYTNPKNPKEYLLIHPQVYGKYYDQFLYNYGVVDQGLAIYYVDEDGGMDLAGDEFDFLVKLVQADNEDQLNDPSKNAHVNNYNSFYGDFTDLYDNVYNTFPNGTPFRWKDGGEFGLQLGEISAPGATMSFAVYARVTTHLVSSDKNGNISPKGVIPAGLSKTYTLLPNPGYELDKLKVNGVAVNVTGNTYTASGSDNKNIEVSYKRKAVQSPFPSPWKQTNIGSNVNGFSAFENGKFHIESMGTNIDANSDNFHFVYREVSGDVTIEGKLSSMNKINRWSKAGLMIRESLAADSKYSMLMFTPRNLTRVEQRSNTGGYSTETSVSANYQLYKWYKVTRVENVITSYVSRDKVTWAQMSQQTLPMSVQLYVGLAVSGVTGQNATLAQFEEVTVTSQNIKPIVAITSPADNSSFTAPLNTVITANASDVDGSVSKVDFFNGSTLLGTDNTAPYSLNWNNVAAGTYNLTAKATDNLGAFTYHTIIVTVTNTPSGPITASVPCGSNNSNIVYELSASQRANATGYNWWYNGSSNGITPVVGSPFKANLSTGNNFGAGQVCVGVNYSSAPWYASYCLSVVKCATAREGLMEEELTLTQAYPNPFSESLNLKLPTQSEVHVYDARGTRVFSTQGIGEVYFGSELSTGVYLVKVISAGNTETLKVIKE